MDGGRGGDGDGDKQTMSAKGTPEHRNLSTQRLPPSQTASEAAQLLEHLRQLDNVGAVPKENLEEKERQIRDALARDVQKRQGFFVIGAIKNTPLPPIVEDEEE